MNRRLNKFLLVIFIAGIFLFVFNFLKRDSSKLISPLAFFNPSPTPAFNKSLEEVVQKSLEGTKGEYAIYIKNLKTNESYFKDKDRVYEPGSLYKLWVMAETFRQIHKGDLKEDEILSGDIANLNKEFNIDPALAEQTSGGITLSVKDSLEQMITISHNYAALLLSKKVKLSQVKAFLESNGFSKSTVGTDGSNPTSTVSEIALFFEKLYKRELISEEYSQKMLEILKRQKLNNKLPKNLPSNIVVAHKTGEVGWFSHDGGIVYSDKGDYIIVVFSESDSPPGAEERIATLSKAVYDYFQQK